MKAFPYLLDRGRDGKAKRLQRLDPNKKIFDERWLQDLLIEHPDLLPTGEIETIFDPLVFLGREVPVSTGRIDILFMSPDGYPVIVETKLWRNPESRREVVAQVLDMAFALSKLEYKQLDDAIKAPHHVARGKKSIKAMMKKHLQTFEIEFETFRENVEKNLKLGRFLVAVVSDRIRSSSRDIFEGLNRYPGLGLELAMIEMECFTVDSKKNSPLLIVPRIAKKTEILERSIVEVTIKDDRKPEVAVSQEKAIDVGGKKKKIIITEAEFWDRLKKKAPQNYGEAKKLVENFMTKPLIEMSPGQNGLRFRTILSDYDRSISLFFIVTDSSINFRPQFIKPQLESLGLETKIVDEFSDRIKKILNGKFRALIDEINLKEFEKTVEDFIASLDQLQSE